MSITKEGIDVFWNHQQRFVVHIETEPGATPMISISEQQAIELIKRILEHQFTGKLAKKMLNELIFNYAMNIPLEELTMEIPSGSGFVADALGKLVQK